MGNGPGHLCEMMSSLLGTTADSRCTRHDVLRTNNNNHDHHCNRKAKGVTAAEGLTPRLLVHDERLGNNNHKPDAACMINRIAVSNLGV